MTIAYDNTTLLETCIQNKCNCLFTKILYFLPARYGEKKWNIEENITSNDFLSKIKFD